MSATPPSGASPQRYWSPPHAPAAPHRRPHFLPAPELEPSGGASTSPPPRLCLTSHYLTEFPNNTRLMNIQQALFKSPRSVEASASGSANKTEELMKRLQIEHDMEGSLKLLMQKELHEQRVTELRDLQKYITDTSWKYTPVEKLIGLH